jgi:hypothetical protein
MYVGLLGKKNRGEGLEKEGKIKIVTSVLGQGDAKNLRGLE